MDAYGLNLRRARVSDALHAAKTLIEREERRIVGRDGNYTDRTMAPSLEMQALASLAAAVEALSEIVFENRN